MIRCVKTESGWLSSADATQGLCNSGIMQCVIWLVLYMYICVSCTVSCIFFLLEDHVMLPDCCKYYYKYTLLKEMLLDCVWVISGLPGLQITLLKPQFVLRNADKAHLSFHCCLCKRYSPPLHFQKGDLQLVANWQIMWSTLSFMPMHQSCAAFPKRILPSIL